MAKKSLPTWSALKQEIVPLGKADLVALVKLLFDYSPDNQLFMAAHSADPGLRQMALEEYRRRVIEQFDDERGAPKLRLRSARNAISDYRRASSDPSGTLDLMLTYVEWGLGVVARYGQIDDAFHKSLDSMLGSIVKMLRNPEGAELYDNFRQRLKRLADTTSDEGGNNNAVFETGTELLRLVGGFESVRSE